MSPKRGMSPRCLHQEIDYRLDSSLSLEFSHPVVVVVVQVVNVWPG